MHSNKLTSLSNKISKLEGVLESNIYALKEVKKTKAQLEESIKLHKEAIELARLCITQHIAKKEYIEKLISLGLTDVFSTPFEFRFKEVYDQNGVLKGLKPEMKEEYAEFDDLNECQAMGPLVVGSISYKLGTTFLVGKTAKVIIADELFANISPALKPRLEQFITNFCNETGFQFILATHMDPFGTIYHVTKTKGKSAVKLVS